MTTDCIHYWDGGCRIAGRECGRETIPVTDRECGFCDRSKHPGPRQMNRVVAQLAIRWLRNHEPEKLPYKKKLYAWVECCGNSKQAVTRNSTQLLLRSKLAPGDVMTMTAAVYSLHATYPGRWKTAVDTTAPGIWDHNPHITPREEADDWTEIELAYPLVHKSNQTSVPFLAGYCYDLSKTLGVPIPIQCNRPALYLSEEERTWIPQVGELYDGETPDYWIVCAGSKIDFTCKRWPTSYYQEVVDATPERNWVQIGEDGHDHPRLNNVIDMRGKTDTRQLIRMAYHSQGGLGPVTFLQHLCAAWRKPYICLLGGREPTTWVQYPVQQTLHTIGMMDCCRIDACWKSRVVPLDDGHLKLDESLCEHPMRVGDQDVAKCMASIDPARVLKVLAGYPL